MKIEFTPDEMKLLFRALDHLEPDWSERDAAISLIITAWSTALREDVERILTERA